jgi:hypothetical protein
MGGSKHSPDATQRNPGLFVTFDIPATFHKNRGFLAVDRRIFTCAIPSPTKRCNFLAAVKIPAASGC